MGVSIDVCEDILVQLDALQLYDAILLSPGPGLPSETQSIFPVLERYATSKKILGICLGMQGIALYFGAKLYNQSVVKHGIQEKVRFMKQSPLFENCPTEMPVGLYHSWAVRMSPDLPLTEVAISENGILMALQHQNLPIYGVQFHPESILTPVGKTILSNFLFRC